MPGAKDPVNYALPQCPLHPFLFPCASRYQQFTCVSNPFRFSVAGCVFVGTSGNSVRSYLSYSDIKSSLSALRQTARARCLCPTAPDSAAALPCATNDPLIFGCGDDENDPNNPHVVFCGCCDNPDTSLEDPHCSNNDQKVRLLCIPSFVSTNKICLVDVNNLDVDIIQFDHY
eukprot:Filipodium_phascolosomae@DN1791_c0_g1_i2.p1